MSKFKVIWYEGYVGVEGSGGICAISNEKEVEANCAEEVNWRDVLPKDESKIIKYFRGIRFEDGTIDYDYGSWTHFVRVERV